MKSKTELKSLKNENLVHYKRNDGPGVVIRYDGKQILVRHGSTYYRVHIPKLQSLVWKSEETLLNISTRNRKKVIPE